MNNLSFTTLSVLQLSIDNVSELIKSTINLAFFKHVELGDLGKAALAQLIADNEKFERAVKNLRKSEFGDLVILMSDERIERFAEIKHIVKLQHRSQEENKKVASEIVDSFFSSYWSVINEPIQSVTSVFKGMIAKYKSDPEVWAAAVSIGIDLLLTEFEDCNNDVETLNNQRIAENAARELSASDLKAAIGNSYSQFCIAIEQKINLTPNESILNLFRDINELRKTYQDLIPDIRA